MRLKHHDLDPPNFSTLTKLRTPRPASSRHMYRIKRDQSIVKNQTARQTMAVPVPLNLWGSVDTQDHVACVIYGHEASRALEACFK